MRFRIFLFFFVCFASSVFARGRGSSSDFAFPDNFVLKAGYQYNGEHFFDGGILIVNGLWTNHEFPRLYQGLNLGCTLAMDREDPQAFERFVAPRIGYELHGSVIPFMLRTDLSCFLLKGTATPAFTPSAGLSLASGILYAAYGYQIPFGPKASELRGHQLSVGIHIPLLLFRVF